MLQNRFNKQPRRDERKPANTDKQPPPMMRFVQEAGIAPVGNEQYPTPQSNENSVVSASGQQTTGNPTPNPKKKEKEQAPHELEGHVINEIYQIEAALEKGGMGQVFRARHLVRNIPVALKLMLKDSDPDDPSFNRFVQECKVQINLHHPNVVGVLDWGIMLGSLKPYLVMEYVEGDTLRRVMQKAGTIPPYEAADLLAQVCAGLHSCHRQGVIHRDMKPENVMLVIENDRLVAKILDFGIAALQWEKSERSGVAIGSLGYMSPEQIRGYAVDERSDLYALGCIFYEMIVGRQPFKANGVRNLMAMHVQVPHTPPSQLASFENSEVIDVIVGKALAKKPEDRYQSAADMQADLAYFAQLDGS